jgi:hypothetical protein
MTAIFLEAGVLVFDKNSSLEKYAEDILANCSSVTRRQSCYDVEIPKLLGRISMEGAFGVTRLIQEKDSGYFYCHVLGHNISAKETSKDPDKWKDVVARCPSNLCSNGCIHGAFQERFRAEALPDAAIEELKPELLGVCEKRPGWNPTNMERATCYHALGHLTMYMTDANIHKSTTLCEEITQDAGSQRFTPICFDGAFMQIFQPLEPEDFALVEGKQPSKEELNFFCNQFTKEERGSCWNEGWPLFFEEVKTPSGLVKFCSTLQDNPSQEKRCYDALFYVLTAQFKLDPERVKNFCGGLLHEKRAQCVSNAATRMIETDKHLIKRSVDLCESAKIFDAHKECYDELVRFSTYNFLRGSPEALDLCANLPEPWGNTCLTKNDRNARNNH